ncbi:Hint domain-containing protein [Paenirhodobacter sp.]|uniref:Hint domain-containing protein n=1 Tax=Paenirhodobacter sp. TaxID=1965326 RepID=UPI003B3DC268
MDEAAARQISIDLMRADLTNRQADFSRGNSGLIGFNAIQQYHSEVFTAAGLGVDCWTAYIPLKLAYEHPQILQEWVSDLTRSPVFSSGGEAQKYMWNLMLGAADDGLVLNNEESLLILGFVDRVAKQSNDPEAIEWANEIRNNLIDEGEYILLEGGSPFPPDGAPHCFPSGTAVLTAKGSIAIESLLPGDLILAFDPSADFGRGALVPKQVVRLFHNETEDWLRLSWREGGEDRELTVTPGHRFLDTMGRFRRIDEIIDDAAPTVVLADGALAQVRAERIVWSEATRHLFEEVETVAMAAGDGLAHRTGGAWRSYNFEVEDLHTYVAGGVRVHNSSQKTIDLAGNLGRVFGTQMANVILDGESQFTKLLGGTVLGAVTENLAEVITSTSYHMFDAHNFSFKESFADALKGQVNNIKPEFVEKPSSVHGFADGCRAR